MWPLSPPAVDSQSSSPMLPPRSERERTRTAELSCWPPSTRYGNALSVDTRYICEVGWFDCSLQLFPPSRLTLAPPSLPSIIRIGSSAEIQTSWLSLWGVETRSKVLPPSSERWKPTFMTQRRSTSAGSAWRRE